MQISEVQEEQVFERKIFLGVENFSVTAVNPTKAELEEMGMSPSEEPNYVSTVKQTIDGEEKDVDMVSIRVFLDNNDADNPIKTVANFNILKTHHMSSTGKWLVLNKYGASTWLEQGVLDGGELPTNMQWYLNEDVKKAYKGEPQFVDFIKALYNLPNVNKKSDEKTKQKGLAKFGDQDFNKMFAGDFSAIRKLIVDGGKGQTVGFLLGARETDEGDYRQTLYTRMPLRSYVKKTDKTVNLVKDVESAQANGAAASTIFDTVDTKLKQFNPELHAAQPDSNIAGQGVGDDDDLPF